MTALVNRESLAAAYQSRFGIAPRFDVRVPGRVNLIGEHVDYHDGLVLPIAIEPAVHAIAGPADDRRIRLFSEGLGRTAEFELDPEISPSSGSWENYARGVAAGLLRAGATLRGANIFVGGDLPMGAGLASSAALEAAVGLALLAVADVPMPREQLAAICRSAEAEFAGVSCGVMDQMACLLAREGHAFLLDCRDLSVRHIPWADNEVVAVVIDSGLRHRLSQSEYNERVSAKSSLVSAFHQTDSSVRSLRDARPDRLTAVKALLPDHLFRYARHVVMEIRRVSTTADALAKWDWATVGKAMDDSHSSLRDDYKVSSPQLDDLVACVRSVPGVFGARLTGAGFGGCVVALAQRSALFEIESSVRTNYDPKYGVRAAKWVSLPGAGATVTPLSGGL